LVIWDHLWDAGQVEQWVAAPVGTWPLDHGELLLRVAFGPGVRACRQIVSGQRRPDVAARDYTLDADVIEAVARESGHPPSWSWCALGSGRVRVQAIWFPSKKDVKRWKEDHPWDTEFAPTVLVPHPVPPPVPAEPVDPFAGHVTVVWEAEFEAADPPRWTAGPTRSWDAHRGALLLRAAGGPHVRGFLWRAGAHGSHERLPLGDHVLDPGVLERKVSNPFEVIFGSAQPLPFHFAFIGSGPARLQLLHLARHDLVEPWCASHPFGGQPVPAGPSVPGLPLPVPVPAPGQEPHPEPGPGVVTDPRTAPGFVSVAFSGQITDAHSGEPLIHADVIVQLHAEPRTIYGGGRTDHSGHYAFSVSVPALTPLVVRVPERRCECQARSFNTPGDRHDWTVRVR
jgi:hypothetical protein